MKLFLTKLMVLCCSFTALAQATAHFTASATIIQPIGIATVSHLNFAEVDANMGGEIILTPEAERIVLGNVELKDATMVSAAAFEITGEPGFAFSISLPTDHFELINGRERMVIKDFKSSLGSTGNLSNGISFVKVGATLEINPNQAPGLYTTPTPLSITVNYN